MINKDKAFQYSGNPNLTTWDEDLGINVTIFQIWIKYNDVPRTPIGVTTLDMNVMVNVAPQYGEMKPIELDGLTSP